MNKKKAKSSKPTVQFQDETRVHPVLKEYVGYCLIKASAWLRAILNEALEGHQIQSHHLGILKVLEVSGRQSQIQLGDEMGFDKASMVKIIDHLEKEKLVERQPHPTDRRVKNVMITAKGVKLIKSSIEVREKVENLFFKDLSTDEQKVFRQLICRVIPDRKPSK